MFTARDTNLILGPPGTGKTTSLLNKLEKEIASGIQPINIGFVSFTKRAIREARERTIQKFNITNENDLDYFRTLHSLCFRTLALNGEQVFKGTHITEFKKLLKIEMSGGVDEEEIVHSGTKLGDQMLFCDQLSRATLQPLKEMWRHLEFEYSWKEQELFSNTLTKFKQKRGLLDFTDMLQEFLERGDPPKLKVLFVDEAQDLTILQWKVVQKLSQDIDKLYIAGDDDQTIYKWAGADIKTFLKLKGNVEVLPYSYRLPKKVYDLAIKISSRIKNRFDKEWKSKKEEGTVNYVSSIEYIDMKKGSWLILTRYNYQLSPIQKFLKNQGFVFENRYGGFKANKHVQGIRAWKKLHQGEKLVYSEIKKLYSCLRTGTGIERGFKNLKTIDENEQYELETLVMHHGLIAQGPWQQALEMIPEEDKFYYEALEKTGDINEDNPRIRISTIHGSKGAEADNVILFTDVSYKTWKNLVQEDDDEHRVFYVGITRVKNNLFIVNPQTEYSYRI